MTTEQRRTVHMPKAAIEKLSLLEQQYADAKSRYEFGALGDRTEIVRAEQLASEIEVMAYDQLRDGADTSGSAVTVELTWPFAEGAPSATFLDSGEKPPADVWRASRRRPSRTDATYERFAGQLAAWADDTGGAAKRKPLCPSEIQNRALTEALREYAEARPGRASADAPVTYRDGSSGPAFPLRAVPFSDVEPQDDREVLRMTLLSVRHVEMDIEVDGAWLRNREISLPRPAGLTDQMVYEQSLEQFKIISGRGPVTLYLYQTGLPTAVVGFYRALIHHNLNPTANAVAVVPFYFAGDDPYAKSKKPWTIR